MATLEVLFERYRSRGDLAALGAVFDRTAPTLLRIALHLCGNRADAEDAVQSTFLRAIEAAATWDAARPLVPWLVGMLGNRARHQRQRASRRPDPRRLAAAVDPDDAAAATDPALAAQRSELDAAVASTIEALPSHVRPVLRLHLLEGRDPAEIAADLARRPGTVRSQLARGLRALRRLLPSGLVAGAAKAQVAASLPRLRGVVLAAGAARSAAVLPAAAATATAAAAATTATSATAATATAFGFGGLAMQKFALGAAAAAVVILCFVWIATPPGPEPAAPASTQQAAVESAAMPRAANADDGATRAEPAGPTRAPAAPDAPPPSDRATLRVRVRHRAEAAPTAGVQVFVVPDRGGVRTSGERHRTTGADGVAVFADLAPGWYSVFSGRTEYGVRDHGDGTSIELAAGLVTEHDLVLDGVTVAGIVVDERDLPIAGARILVDALHVRELTTTGNDGTFLLRGLGPEVRLGARAAGHAPSPLHRIPAPQGGEVAPLRIVLPAVGGRLVCAVVDTHGAPIRDAQVSVGAGHWHANDDVAAWIVTTDERGEAVFDGVALGDVDVFAWAERRSPWRGTAAIVAGEPAQVTIELQPGAVLHGQVRDANGRPLADRQVAVGRASSEAYRTFGRFAWQFATTGDDGSYRLEGLPPGRIDAEVSGAVGAVAASATLAANAGETVRWDPVLAPGTGVRGRILGPDGRGIAANIEASSGDRRGWYGHAFSDGDGRFAVQGIEPKQHLRLVASLDVFPIARFEGAVPEDGEIELRVAAEAMPSARIAGVVVDERGQPLPLAEVSIVQRGHGNSPVFQTGDGGRFDVGTFPPGEFCLFVTAEGRARKQTDWFAVAPGATTDAGTIRLEPGCTVEVHLHSNAPLRDPTYLPVIDVRNVQVGHVEIRGGRGELGALAAGRHTLLVMTGGAALARHEFDVAAASPTRLDLTVDAGVPTTFALQAGERVLPKFVALELTAADGRVLLDTRCGVHRDGRISTRQFGLLPGAYGIRLRDPDSRALLGERAFTVEPGAAECAVEVPFAGR